MCPKGHTVYVSERTYVLRILARYALVIPWNGRRVTPYPILFKRRAYCLSPYRDAFRLPPEHAAHRSPLWRSETPWPYRGPTRRRLLPWLAAVGIYRERRKKNRTPISSRHYQPFS